MSWVASVIALSDSMSGSDEGVVGFIAWVSFWRRAYVSEVSHGRSRQRAFTLPRVAISRHAPRILKTTAWPCISDSLHPESDHGKPSPFHRRSFARLTGRRRAHPSRRRRAARRL